MRCRSCLHVFFALVLLDAGTCSLGDPHAARASNSTFADDAYADDIAYNADNNDADDDAAGDADDADNNDADADDAAADDDDEQPLPPGWERWASEDVPNVSGPLFCALLGDAAHDLERRGLPGFQGWRGDSPPFRVPYVVKATGDRGLGVFAATPIKAGLEVYVDDPSTFVRVPMAAVGSAAEVAHGCSPATVRHLLQWAVADSSKAGDGVLIQVDDGRYLNSNSQGEKATLAECRHKRAMCASRDLRPGDELTEDYEGENLDDPESDWVVGAIISASARRLARPDYCAACSAECSADLREQAFLSRLEMANRLRGRAVTLGPC